MSPEVILKVVTEFLDTGIAGAVALVSLWFAWRRDRESRNLLKSLRTHEKEHAKEKLQLQKESFERLISSQDKQNARYERVLKDMRDTVLTLAESVQYEELAPLQLEPGREREGDEP